MPGRAGPTKTRFSALAWKVPFFTNSSLLGKGSPNPQDIFANPLGPHHAAGFYRTEALQKMECLHDFGSSTLGLEIALTLEAIGYESKVCPNSRVQFKDLMELEKVNGSESQNLIWRFAGSLGFAQGLLTATGAVLKDCAGLPFSKKSRGRIVGRLANFMNLQAARSFQEYVDNADGPEASQIHSIHEEATLPLSGIATDSSQRKAA